MTRNEIIEKWYKEGIVEDICRNLKVKHTDDLIQLVYLALLKLNDEVFFKIHENGEYKYYIARIAMNSISGGQYYQDYVKNEIRNQRIVEGIIEAPEEEYNDFADKFLDVFYKLPDAEREKLWASTQRDAESFKEMCEKYYPDQSPSSVRNYIYNLKLKLANELGVIPQKKNYFIKIGRAHV